MAKRHIILIAFVVVALVQLYFPVKMILAKETVIGSGKEFRFRTAPVDPTDPFRGKYVALNFAANEVAIPFTEKWERGETVYVSLATDSLGFAKIQSVSKVRPGAQEDFIVANVNYVSRDVSNSRLFVRYPFNRFYMEESKAPAAEKEYNRLRADRNMVAYALVKVRAGDAVLEDVIINGVSLRHIAGADGDPGE